MNSLSHGELAGMHRSILQRGELFIENPYLQLQISEIKYEIKVR